MALTAFLLISCDGSQVHLDIPELSPTAETPRDKLETAARNINQVLAIHGQTLPLIMQRNGTIEDETMSNSWLISQDLNNSIRSFLLDNAEEAFFRGDKIVIEMSPEQICRSSEFVARSYRTDAVSLADDQCYDPGVSYFIYVTPIGADSGLVEVELHSKIFLSVNYTPTSLSVKINIGNLFSVFESSETVQSAGLTINGEPPELRGVLEMFLETRGTEAGSIRYSILDTFQISDSSNDFEFTIDPSILFMMNFDGRYDQLSFTSDYPLITAAFQQTIDEATVLPAKLSLRNFLIDLYMQKVSPQIQGDFGLGPVAYAIDGIDVFNLSTSQSFSYDTGEDVLTLVAPLSFELETNSTFGWFLADGSVSINSNAGSKFKILTDNSTGESVYQLIAGNFSIQGSVDYIDASLTLSLGQCISTDLIIISCPAAWDQNVQAKR